MSTVVGLDLSLTGTGIAVLKNDKLIHSGVIKSKPLGDTPTHEIKRLQGIVNEIADMISALKVDLIVIEGLAFMAHQTTAIMQLAGLNYMVRAMAMASNIPFAICAPMTLKKFICEKGNMHKEQVLLEVYKQYGESMLDNNVADAFVLAKIGAASLGNHKLKLRVRQTEVATLIKKQLV